MRDLYNARKIQMAAFGLKAVDSKFDLASIEDAVNSIAAPCGWVTTSTAGNLAVGCVWISVRRIFMTTHYFIVVALCQASYIIPCRECAHQRY